MFQFDDVIMSSLRMAVDALAAGDLGIEHADPMKALVFQVLNAHGLPTLRNVKNANISWCLLKLIQQKKC